MGLVTGIVQDVVLADGQTVKVRMLNYLQLKAAKDARLPEIARNTALLADLKDLIMNDPTIVRPPDDPEELGSYDIPTLLEAGVVSWTYPVELDTDAFDEETAPIVARAILRLSKPRASDLGKASSSSIAT